MNPARSEVHGSPTPDATITVEQSNAELTLAVAVDRAPVRYPLNGTSDRRKAGDITIVTSTKWEGAALLATTLVSGTQNYTVTERWRQSRDGKTLTITRVINRRGTETESVLVYERDTGRAESLAQNASLEPAMPVPAESLVAAPPAKTKVDEYVVGKGERILLRLSNPLDTRHTQVGDRVYLETAVPVTAGGRLVIPRGSYVSGTVTESKGAGRVAGRAALNLRFEKLVLTNGFTVDLLSRAGSVEGHGDADPKEGRIEGQGSKGRDAKTVGTATAAGGGIGAAAGHAGVGALAGAAAGLAGVLMSRGPEVVLAVGTSVEMVLDRDLRFTDEQLR